MYPILKNDQQNLEHLLDLIKDKAIAHLNQLDDVPVSINDPSVIHQLLSDEGQGLEKTIAEFYQQHYDKMVSAPGSRYWGYVIGGTTPAAIAGDWLTTVFDQNPQGIKGGGDVSALVEFQTIGWLLDLFNLPKTFKGGFVSGATMSNFTCLAVGRQWAGKQKNNDIAREGIRTEIKVLTATLQR